MAVAEQPHLASGAFDPMAFYGNDVVENRRNWIAHQRKSAIRSYGRLLGKSEGGIGQLGRPRLYTEWSSDIRLR